MAMYDVFKKLQRLAAAPVAGADAKARQLIETHAWNGKLEGEWNVDAVTTATPLYDASFTYGVGDKPNQPAVTMTQFAARQYTKWLSGLTGRDFRLPTEAEWEYAARAGTTTAYSFGGDAATVADFAWLKSNSQEQPHVGGQKKPNPWGLFDVHGNAAEWTRDLYDAGYYAKSPADNPFNDPAKGLYPHVVRGGSWDDEPARLRSAARRSSVEAWSRRDPQNPKSLWWHTDATFVGFRVVAEP
jgi:formylglycine-generating enzyme required for sulfatase activity